MRLTTVTSEKRTPPSILILGPPGSGKTTLALQFPRPAIANCDDNLNGPMDYFKAKKYDKPFYVQDIVYDENGNKVAPGDRWDRIISFVASCRSKPEIGTIIIDSLTQANEALIQHIYRTQHVEEMSQRHWIPFRSELMKMIMGAKTAGKVFILIAHEEYDLKQSKKTGEMEVTKVKPSVNSRLSDYFGHMFTDIWRCTTSRGVNGPEHWVRFCPDHLIDLKCSRAAAPKQDIQVEPPNGFEVINKFMQFDFSFVEKSGGPVQPEQQQQNTNKT